MRILHYNDEERALHSYLAERGHENVILSEREDPFARISEESFDAAFVGLHPHGFQLITGLRRMNPDCLVTLVTEDRNARHAVEAMKLGAFDYLLIPLDFAEVERTVIMLNREHQGQRERLGLEGRLARVQGNSSAGTARETSSVRSLREIIGEVERTAIREALQEFEGNVAQSARALEISRTTLYSKMRNS
jgi:two-component system response regulator HydG